MTCRAFRKYSGDGSMIDSSDEISSAVSNADSGVGAKWKSSVSRANVRYERLHVLRADFNREWA